MKAQMKIQEMAFVLLALVLLALIGFIFFLRLSQQKFTESAETIKAKTTISLLERIASLPELECPRQPLCIDEDKANMFIQQSDKLSQLFQGLTKVRIKRIYPSGPDLILYDTGQGNSSYSTFISLCKYNLATTPLSYNCNMALIVASQGTVQ